ncbi:hypothetical protein [Xanthomonas phage RTH11]|nr:hypothetical protein [Xanthomonas phage RTH11]
MDVLKKDGSKEPFDVSKMPAVIIAACDPGVPGAEKTVIEWQPKWPSVKNLGGELKALVDGEYADWRLAQGEDFNTPVHLVAHVQEWPYRFVVDFLQRLPTLVKLTGFASIEVKGPPSPSERTDEQWHEETMRVLRTLNGPEVFVTSDGGAILSKGCIVALVEELHKRAFAGTTVIDLKDPLQAQLIEAATPKEQG